MTDLYDVSEQIKILLSNGIFDLKFGNNHVSLHVLFCGNTFETAYAVSIKNLSKKKKVKRNYSGTTKAIETNKIEVKK